MKKDLLILMLGIIKKLNNKDEQIRELFKSENYYLSEEMDELQTLVLDQLSFPQDNYSDVLKKHEQIYYYHSDIPVEEFHQENWYSRDFLFMDFYDYLTGEISQEELINKFLSYGAKIEN